MTDGKPDADVDAIRQEIELVRREMTQQETELEGRINVMQESVNNLKSLVYGVLVALGVIIVGAVILRAAGLS